MTFAVTSIAPASLLLAFLPVVMVLYVLMRWRCDSGATLFAVLRMVVQLVIVGYLLNFLFQAKSSWPLALVLSMMLIVSSWIGIRPLRKKDRRSYGRAMTAISVGSIPTLLLIVLGVMQETTLLKPRLIIPLAGMVFPPSMNVVSLIVERLQAERERGTPFLEARAISLRAALIPVTNSLLAVGLVSLPGMMTGQILAGIDPLEAVRYQIMVMCMIFGASGISATTFLSLCAVAENRRLYASGS